MTPRFAVSTVCGTQVYNLNSLGHLCLQSQQSVAPMFTITTVCVTQVYNLNSLGHLCLQSQQSVSPRFTVTTVCGTHVYCLNSLGQCLIQDKISTSPSPTDRRAVVTPRGRARSSHWAIVLLNNIAITNNSTFPKIKLHYSKSYCNKTKSNNLI